MAILNNKDFKMLWANDWYDGPLYGMAMYKEEKCFYFFEEQIFEKEHNRNKLVYKVYKLTPEQLKYEEEQQQCFVENVGTYFDFLRTEKIRHPEEKWVNYYNKYPIENNIAETYMTNEFIGEYIEYGETLKQ